MNDSIVVAVLSLCGTLFGSLAGIVASGKLTAFRLTSLENKVDDFGKLTQKIPLLERDQQNIERRLSNLEKNTSSLTFSS